MGYRKHLNIVDNSKFDKEMNIFDCIKIVVACKIIGIGLKIMPKRFRSTCFISNMMKTGHIKRK